MTTFKNTLNNDENKTLPFAVPENYFVDFAEQMDRQIGLRKKKIQFIRPWMYAAAVFVGIMISTPLIYRNSTQPKNTNSENYETYVMSQVDESSVMDYYVTEPSK